MFNKLFSPARIGPLTLSNRLVVAPMDTDYGIPGNNGRVSKQHISYFVEKAHGGWGMLIVEANAITERNNPQSRDMAICSDEYIEGHRQLTEAVHEKGSKICVQLVHSGRQSSYNGNGKAPFAPSPVPDPMMGYIPTEISVQEIKSLKKAFGEAAERAKKAGYDAVEIHGAHGYLLSEFLSPYANKRTDEYGGSLEGRARLSLEVIKEVKERCGKDFPVIFRISVEDGLPFGEGMRLPDTLSFALMLEEAGIDAIDASYGNYTSIEYMIPPAALPRGFNGQLISELKKIVSVPVISVGRFTDPYIAESALRAGYCDFVSMGRQSLADPDFPQKAMMGEVDDIRRCIGCQSGCVENLWKGTPIHCAVNPRIGYEEEYREIPEKAENKKIVVIIGGGVGGCSAAISAAEMGHEVTLYEASDRLGGQVNLACRPPYKQELASFVSWQKQRLLKLGVKMIFNHEVKVGEDVFDGADEIVLATGAKPIVPPFKGADKPHVCTHSDALSCTKPMGECVAVIGGGDVGCETAAFLASTGKKTVVFEMMDDICTKMESSVKGFLISYLKDKGVQINVKSKVLEITEDTVIYEQSGIRKEYGPLNNVVIAVGSKPYNPLYDVLKEKYSTHLIGDAGSVGRVIDAVSEGYRVGKKI